MDMIKDNWKRQDYSPTSIVIPGFVYRAIPGEERTIFRATIGNDVFHIYVESGWVNPITIRGYYKW